MKKIILTILILGLIMLSGCAKVSKIEQIKNYCEQDSDCKCGKLGNNCVFANKEFNLEKGCEDFCHGPEDNIKLVCVNNKCIQEYDCIFDSDCGQDGLCKENACIYGI